MCSKVFFVVVVRGVKIFLMSVDRLLLFFYSPFVLAANRSLSQGRRRRKKGRKAKDTEEREQPAAISERTIIIQQRREAGKRKMDVGPGQNLLNYFSKRNGMTARLLLSAMRFLAGGPSCSNLATLPSCKKILGVLDNLLFCIFVLL